MIELKYGDNFTMDNPSKKLRDLDIPIMCYMFDNHSYHIVEHKPNYTTTEELIERLQKDNEVSGLQHASIITAHDNSAELNPKLNAVRIKNGEVIRYQGKEYKTNLKGNYSDAVEFIPVEDEGKRKKLDKSVTMSNMAKFYDKSDRTMWNWEKSNTPLFNAVHQYYMKNKDTEGEK